MRTSSNNSSMMDREEIDELRTKMAAYAEFIDKTLQPELLAAVTAREETEAEIAEYEELLEVIRMILARAPTPTKKPLESMVDLGHEIAFCKATIHNPQQLFVHVGMGFHAELSLDEAIGFCAKRISFIERQILTKRVDKAKRVAAHLEAALVMLQELAIEVQDMERTNINKGKKT
jgi:prefoldin subunit 5